jgi:hypothetical protein
VQIFTNLNQVFMKKVKNLIIACIEPVKAEDFNTNNAWGFGGGYGTEYTYPSGASIRLGTACYRHSCCSKYVALYNKEGHRVHEWLHKLPDNMELIEKVIKTGLQ